LYVAIVVIWAAVLIPRWLRRDSAVPVSDSAPAEDGEMSVTDETVEEEQPSPVFAPVRVTAGPPMPRNRRPESRPERPVRAASERDAADRGADDRGFEDRARRGRDVPDDERAHRRVVSARRRLLGMLTVLAAGSAVLAVAEMAAWWVIVPPSVMLLGYMLMLREASKADAEQRADAHARRVEAERARRRRPAPVAQVITIPAAPEPEEESIYDQYADAKLRAVGD
jgi:hypothetical protein